MSCPCKDCPERHPACHDRCERYIEWRDKWRAAKEHLRQMKPAFSTSLKRIWWENIRRGKR